MAATSPVTKLTSCRIRTASEGDGSPIRPGVNRTHLSRSNTVTARPCRTFEASSLQHSKSMCMPVSHSPPSTASPVSMSCSNNIESGPRPSSCTASISGSPSDAGFISCDECGSSPGDIRLLLAANRSNTPESLTDTPPATCTDTWSWRGPTAVDGEASGQQLRKAEEIWRMPTGRGLTPSPCLTRRGCHHKCPQLHWTSTRS